MIYKATTMNIARGDRTDSGSRVLSTPDKPAFFTDCTDTHDSEDYIYLGGGNASMKRAVKQWGRTGWPLGWSCDGLEQVQREEDWPEEIVPEIVRLKLLGIIE